MFVRLTRPVRRNAGERENGGGRVWAGVERPNKKNKRREEKNRGGEEENRGKTRAMSATGETRSSRSSKSSKSRKANKLVLGQFN